MTQVPHCTYELTHNTIHRFTLVHADQQAMDEFVLKMAQIIDDTPEHEQLNLLIDFRPDGIPPLRYAVTTVRDMLKERKAVQIRVAYLHEPNPVMSLVTTFLDRLRIQTRIQTQRRLFSGGDAEAEALEWIQSDEA